MAKYLPIWLIVLPPRLICKNGLLVRFETINWSNGDGNQHNILSLEHKDWYYIPRIMYMCCALLCLGFGGFYRYPTELFCHHTIALISNCKMRVHVCIFHGIYMVMQWNILITRFIKNLLYIAWQWQVQDRSDHELTKDTSYLAVIGELWNVFWVFGDKMIVSIIEVRQYVSWWSSAHQHDVSIWRCKHHSLRAWCGREGLAGSGGGWDHHDGLDIRHPGDAGWETAYGYDAGVSYWPDVVSRHCCSGEFESLFCFMQSHILVTVSCGSKLKLVIFKLIWRYLEYFLPND